MPPRCPICDASTRPSAEKASLQSHGNCTTLRCAVIHYRALLTNCMHSYHACSHVCTPDKCLQVDRQHKALSHCLPHGHGVQQNSSPFIAVNATDQAMHVDLQPVAHAQTDHGIHRHTHTWLASSGPILCIKIHALQALKPASLTLLQISPLHWLAYAHCTLTAELAQWCAVGHDLPSGDA